MESPARKTQNSNSSVLFVGNFLSSSRAYRGVCEELAPRLGAAGMSVVTTSSYPGRLFRLLDIARTCWRERHRYDIAQVDVNSGPAFVLAEVACWVLRRARKPYVLTLRGGNLPEFARRWPKRVRSLLSSAAAVTTPSNYLRKKLLPYGNGFYVLPNALDITHYTFRLRERPQPQLVWMRSFHEIYNPSLAVEALSLLTADFQNLHLMMVGHDKGDGSLQRTQQSAARLGIPGLLTLRGGVPKPEVPSWLNTGDIFLNTPNVDNTPVTVIEAMACGLCIVSTHVGGIPYLLENGLDALLVPPNDAESMATAVRRILTEPDLARHLSRNARRKAEQFDWSNVLPQWEQLLSWAVRRSSD